MENVQVSQQVLFENRSLRLALLEKSILLVQYKLRASNEEYKLNLSRQVELVRKHNVARAIFDLRKMGVLSAENQKYTSEVYMPEITRAGLRYSAIIVPQDLFGEVSAKNVTDKIKSAGKVPMQYFGDLPAAIAWLGTV
jgi:hypothetical protein